MTVSARPAIASKYASNDSFDENEDRLYVKKSDIYTSDEDSDDYNKGKKSTRHNRKDTAVGMDYGMNYINNNLIKDFDEFPNGKEGKE